MQILHINSTSQLPFLNGVIDMTDYNRAITTEKIRHLLDCHPHGLTVDCYGHIYSVCRFVHDDLSVFIFNHHDFLIHLSSTFTLKNFIEDLLASVTGVHVVASSEGLPSVV